MTNFAALTDQALIEATDLAASRERDALVSVLDHLREIERRRLFSTLGYTSLWDYAVKRLKYSEDQAYRRISTMRLVREMPELEEKIESGSLTLTNLGLAQSLFKAEEKNKNPLPKRQKSELIKKLENKSKREAQQIIIKESSQPLELKPEKIKSISDDQVTIQFTADNTLLEKIETLKGLLAHTHPHLTLKELLHRLCDLGIEKLDPARRRTKTKSHQSPAPARVTNIRRRQIPSHVKKQIWLKNNSRCNRCASRRALQIEHIHPVAKGGTDDLANLTLLCRACNQRSAIEQYGQQRMDVYLRRPGPNP